jgi:hypothetical protein
MGSFCHGLAVVRNPESVYDALSFQEEEEQGWREKHEWKVVGSQARRRERVPT